MNGSSAREKISEFEEIQVRKEKKINLSIYDILVRSIGYLLSRAQLISGVAPFGAAFLSAERRFDLRALLSMVISALGYISLWDFTIACKYIAALSLYMIFLAAAGREDTDISTKEAVVASGVSVAIANVGVMIWNGFSAGGVIQLFCDSALTCIAAVVFERSRGLLSGRKSGLFTMNAEQKVCFSILSAIILMGFGSVEIYGFFAADNVIGLWISAMLALSGGAIAVAVGAVIGLIAGMWDNMLAMSAIFALCTLSGAAVSKFGKTATALSMAGAAAVSVLIGGTDALYLFGYADIPLFVISVLLTPDYAVRLIGRVTGLRNESSDEARCREYIKSRLNSAASSFQTLADTFLDLSGRNEDEDIKDVSALFDGVADRVCRECSRMSECWVNNFNATYKSMFHMLRAAEKRGELAEVDADENFSRKCLRLRAIVREMNRLFEIYKINCVWKSKLHENRELAGEQLASVAQILDDISCELCEDKPDAAAEEEIRMRLAVKGVETGALDVTVNPKGRYMAYIEFFDGRELSDSRRIAESILRAVLGVRLSAAGAIETANGITVRFNQPEGYRIESGSASVGSCEECGDNCVMRYLSGGKYAAALSDGMGTGYAAARDSGATVRLLGDFLEAGFDKSIAVRLVNSIMVMRSASEAFATVDMCVIDLFGGEAEFIKNGAEPSYIKRGDIVETIRAASLPVGIMQEMEIESFAHKLIDGDIIVMTSDGLQMKKGHEDWIRTMVEEADKNMPAQELADRIIDMANTLHGGVAEDDMTVMVMKLAER